MTTLSKFAAAALVSSVALAGCGYISSGGEYTIQEGLAGATSRPTKVASARSKIPTYADQLKNAAPSTLPVASKPATVRSDDILLGANTPSAPSSAALPPAAAPLAPTVSSQPLQAPSSTTVASSNVHANSFDIADATHQGRAKLAEPFNPSAPLPEAVPAQPLGSAVTASKIKSNETAQRPTTVLGNDLAATSAVLPASGSNGLPAAKTELAKGDAEPVEEPSFEKEAATKLDGDKNQNAKAVEKRIAASNADDLADVAAHEEHIKSGGLTDRTDSTRGKAEVEKKSVSPAVTSTAVSSTAKAVGEEGGDCGKAEGEAVRARASVSEADQLFYFRRALRLCPKSTQYHLEIGKIYSTLGRKEDAEFEFRQVLDLDPKNQEAKNLLGSTSKN